MDDFKLCFICGGRNSFSTNCKTCSQPCCQLCINLHKTPSLCKIISKYGSHLTCLSETCEIHGGLEYCFFCMQCSTKTCKECKASHSNHTILRLQKAVKQIKETFQNHKHILQARQYDAIKVIEDTPRKYTELTDTEMKIEEEVIKWDKAIFKISNALQITLSDDRNKIEEIAEKAEETRTEIGDAITNLIAMEKINFELTFLALWSGYSNDLTMLEKNDVELGIPKRKTFKSNLGDISDIRNLFGFLWSEGTKFGSSEIQTSEKKIPGAKRTDDLDQLSQRFSHSVTVTDETDKKRHSKHKGIVQGKQALEKEVTELEIEIKDTLKSKQKQEHELRERKAMEINLLKLEGEVENYSRKTTELSTENIAMEESVRGLLHYILHVRSSTDTCLPNNVKTVPEMVEFVRNQITELQHSLSKHVILEKDNIQEKYLPKDGEKMPTKTQDEFDSLLNQKENLESQVLEMNNKVKEISMANQELIKKQAEMQTLLLESIVKPNILTRGCNVTLEEDAMSLSEVVSLILNHITKLNGSLNELENQIKDEKNKTYELMNEQTDKDEKKKELTQEQQNKLVMLESELKSMETILNKNKTSMLKSDQKLKDLQGQYYESLQEKTKIEEKYRNACDQINNFQQGNESIQMVLDGNEKRMAELTRTIDNMSRSLKEKENEVMAVERINGERTRREEKLRQEISRQNGVISDIEHKLRQQKGIITDLEEKITLVRVEKDDLQTRLSSVAGEKLTKGNPSITDLGDPNRPMKIGEKYGELYDNEWTDAMENIGNVKKYFPEMTDGEIEEIIIRHLQRLLKCCYTECLMKAEDQIHKLGEALAETMYLTFESKEEMVNLPVCREASVLRRAKSEDFAKLLFQKQVLCKNTVADWDYINKNESVMQILLESSFFEKCVYLCWSMVIQDPVMYLDDEPIPLTPIDKNTYKEFVKSGDSVAYVVWPALFLHKDGPLLYKGVVQAYWKTDEGDNIKATSD